MLTPIRKLTKWTMNIKSAFLPANNYRLLDTIKQKNEVYNIAVSIVKLF